MNIVICTLKSWNIELAEQFKRRYEDVHSIKIISDKKNLEKDYIGKDVDYIFFPHWSFIIPKEIYECYNCIVFHMTDLPFGRGGSPLQNLIVRGIKDTKISALKVNEELDAGPIYMKSPLNLDGNAESIYRRASGIIFNEMIPYILKNNPIPHEQMGTAVSFARRKPEESKLLPQMKLETIYDYIRMLDAEGYPKAFIEYGKNKLYFSGAKLENGKITAKVEIMEEIEE